MIKSDMMARRVCIGGVSARKGRRRERSERTHAEVVGEQRRPHRLAVHHLEDVCAVGSVSEARRDRQEEEEDAQRAETMAAVSVMAWNASCEKARTKIGDATSWRMSAIVVKTVLRRSAGGREGGRLDVARPGRGRNRTHR